MKSSSIARSALLTLCTSLLCAMPQASYAAEEVTPVETVTDKTVTDKKPIADRFEYTQDGPLTKLVHLPTYVWMPKTPPVAMVLAVHGLTLHGRRYTTLGRTFAVNGIGVVAFDMRGFGRARFDDKNEFSNDGDDKRRIDNEKSYKDIEKLALAIKQEHPTIPLVVLGESLGCTFCVRLAASQKQAVDGLILSAPAVKVNAKMYASASELGQGLKAIVVPGHKINLTNFITKLVSQRQEVVNEMLQDPLVLKELSLHDLIATDDFVETTARWGKGVSPRLAVLILQGGGDGCVAPKSVTDLMANMPSTDQTLRWLGHIGHLQLETSFVRSLVIDAIGDWLDDHNRDAPRQLQALEQAIRDTGGTLVE